MVASVGDLNNGSVAAPEIVREKVAASGEGGYKVAAIGRARVRVFLDTHLPLGGDV